MWWVWGDYGGSDVCCSGSGCLYSKPSSEWHQPGPPALSRFLDSLCWPKYSWCTTNEKLFSLFTFFLSSGDIHLLTYWRSYPSRIMTVEPTWGRDGLALQIEEASFICNLMRRIFMCTAGICGCYQISKVRIHSMKGLGSDSDARWLNGFCCDWSSVLSLLQLSLGDGNHVSLSMRAVERATSTAAGVTFPPLLLNLINYGSEQKPRRRGDSKPVTLSGPWGDCE